MRRFKDWVCSHRGHRWAEDRPFGSAKKEVQKCRRCGVVSFKDRI